MKMPMKAFILTLVIGLAPVLGAAQLVAASPAAQALPETRNPPSSKFTITGSISDGTTTIQISGNGATSGNDAMMDLTFSVPDLPQEQGPNSFTISMIIIGDKLYFKITGLTPGAEDQWYVTDAGTGMGAGVPGMPGTVPDPALMEAFTVSTVGKETLHGAPTTKYRIDVDLERLLAASGDTDPQSAQIARDSTFVMFLWVGDNDMYVHQLSLDLDLRATVSGPDEPGIASITLMMDLTITFSDFGTPVTITAPPDAEPLDLGTGGVTTGLIPGMPTSVGILPGMPIGMTTGMPTSGGGGQPAMPVALLAAALLFVGAGVLVRRVALA